MSLSFCVCTVATVVVAYSDHDRRLFIAGEWDGRLGKQNDKEVVKEVWDISSKLFIFIDIETSILTNNGG